ncbi:hypothetical protein Droror1_Dr00012105, partial [Drosera rotundifolia]
MLIGYEGDLKFVDECKQRCKAKLSAGSLNMDAPLAEDGEEGRKIAKEGVPTDETAPIEEAAADANETAHADKQTADKQQLKSAIDGAEVTSAVDKVVDLTANTPSNAEPE